MRIIKQIFRGLLMGGVLSLVTISVSFGQVVTRVLSPETEIGKYIPWYNPNEKIPQVTAPIVNVAAVLEEDRKTGRVMPRIGIKQNVNYTTNDGQLIKRDNYAIWNMTLYSKDAKSMSIRFDNTYLPEEAVMFLYNKNSKFIIGPIANIDFRSGTFLSDYLNGNRMTISVFIPTKVNKEKFSINITSYNYGIVQLMDSFQDDDFEDSQPCNVNVACSQTTGLECQVTSICKIIIGEGSCTGTLINNDCCDLTPYVLTANHCFTASEIDPINWHFRFNYQSDLCNSNNEPSQSQWVTYWGANDNASWGGTDFYLLELIQDIRIEDRLSYAGWDRTNYVGNNTTILHHPQGDIKKITYDDEPAEIENDETLLYPPNLVAGRYVRIELSNGQNGDIGITEKGSSGAPYFNDNNLIFAQHRGGATLTCMNTGNMWAGRISASWEGNGTNATRLRNWLGASRNPNTMDCMEHPTIAGPEIICDEYYNLYFLQEDMPCQKTIKWNVSPSHLFEFSTPTSGSGKGLALKGASGASGSATLTYTLSSNNCNNTEIEYDFWVGKPSDPTYFLQAWYDPFLERITLSVPEIPGATSYNWTVENLTFNNRSNFEKFSYQACPSIYQDIRFSVTAVNKCGESTTLYGEIERDCGGGPFGPLQFSVYPNPSNGDFTIYFNHRNDAHSALRSLKSEVQKCLIYNIQGEVIMDFVVEDAVKSISGLVPGVYIIKVYNNVSQTINKIIVN